MSDPAALWLLRHGQSEGNVVRDAAAGSDIHVLDIAERDMDVPLSALGREQARVFGTWLGRQPSRLHPDVVLSSPYVRSADTARLLVDAAGLDRDIHLDERLRERELGVLDLLTRHGVQARFPDEARRRERLGKFYHRPPGGESWVDVALRLRSLRDSLAREHDGRRVLVVTHEVVVAITRYLLEELDEQQALAVAADHPQPNCGLTTYETGPDGRLVLDKLAWTVPLDDGGTPVTDEPDARVAPR